MTRLWSDGAEFGDLLFWSSLGGSASTTQKRSGNYSYYLGGSDAIKNVSDLSEFYLRIGFYFSSAIASAPMVVFRHSTTELAYLYVNATGSKMQAYVGGSPVYTGSIPVTINTWHLLECHLKIDDNPNGIINTYLDGIEDIDFTGDTKPGADAHIDNIYVRGYNGIYVDDLGLDDATWCGDGHIELLTPNDNGDVNDWTGSDGDKVNNYLLVDDIPASGDDYNKSSTPTEQQLYKLTDFTATGKIITRVWPECRAKDNDNTAGQIKLGMKIASTHLSASAITLPGAYSRIVGDEETTNPDDSSAWEDADLDSIQFVAECE